MGKQAKIKAWRKQAREAKRIAEVAQKAMAEATQREAVASAIVSPNPPDLGVVTQEVVNTSDKFGG